jgi:hypothetical protein
LLEGTPIVDIVWISEEPAIICLRVSKNILDLFQNRTAMGGEIVV